MDKGVPGEPPTAFPLTAIVGNPDVVDAMSCLLCGGGLRTLLIIGSVGTGKSVAARAVSSISRDRRVVELPLNSTAEQVFGSIDVDKAVTSGIRRVTDSVMMRADRNILLVDNANLLPKSILHSVLDAVTTGTVIAELDGASVHDDCDTILIATMDPSEAELSPHELDRFDLCVRMSSRLSEDERLEVLRRALSYSRDPRGFASGYAITDTRIADRISDADPEAVGFPGGLLELVPRICAELGVQGHRGDVAVTAAATALAAVRGLPDVDPACLRDAVRMCLHHRAGSREDDDYDDVPDGEIETAPTPPPLTTATVERTETSPSGPAETGAWSESMAALPPLPAREDVVFEIGASFKPRDFLPEEKRLSRDRDSGRRGLMLSRSAEGRCIGYEVPRGRPRDVALGATIRMAAPHQTTRDRRGMAIAIEPEDVRDKVRVRSKGEKMIFVVDGSGSMDAERRMVAVKGTILSILEEAYRRRDMVGLVVFKGDAAEEVLPMTRSVLTAYEVLRDMPTGGRTPLASGLQLGYRLLRRYCTKGEEPVMIVMTDGWGNVNVDPRIRPWEELEMTCGAIRDSPIRPVVIDTEPRGSKFRKAPKLAGMLGSECLLLEEMDSESLSRTVESTISDMESKPRYTR